MQSIHRERGRGEKGEGRERIYLFLMKNYQLS